MLDIYLCEDSKEQLLNWKKTVENYIMMSTENCTLKCAASTPKELLTIRKESSLTGLYFLDIDLQSSINGLELAQEIRKIDSRGYIVFITTHSEMNLLTFRYKIEAMDFILKDEPDNLPTRICDCIKTADIPRKIVIHTTDGIYQMNGGLKELSESLGPAFFQCSRSVIVKLDRIKEYQVNHSCLILDNNEIIQVSIRMAGKLKKLLRNS